MTHKLKNELLEFAEGPFGYEGERSWQSRGEHLMEKLYWHAELTNTSGLQHLYHPDDLPVIDWLACGDFFSTLAITCAEAAKRIGELETQVAELQRASK